MDSIYIVVVIYNSAAFIEKFIQNIEKAVSLSHLIIVDNNSKDATDSIIERYKKITFIKSPKNLGYAGGNNLGIKHAIKHGAKYIFILNPDVFLDKNCIKYLLENFSKNEKLGIAGPKILTNDKKIWSLGGIIDKKRYSAGLIKYGINESSKVSFSGKVDFISGTAILIDKKVFDKIGFFDEKYFLYYEDVDFCVRANKVGFDLYIDMKAKIIHYESSSVGKNSKNMQYYMARNHLMFVNKFAPTYIKLREMIRIPKTIWEARSKKYELFGIRDYFLGKSGAVNI